MNSSLGSRPVLGVVVVALLMSGCQASPSAAPPARPVTPVRMHVFQSPAQAPTEEQADLLSGLNLTEQQRQQLGALQGSVPQDRSADFQRELSAPQVDRAALRALLAPSDESIASSVNAWVSLRDILTPEQRQQLLQRMSQAPQEEAMEQTQVPDELRQQMGLTSEQLTALSALNQSFNTYSRASRARMRAAIAMFMTSGNANALRQATLEDAREMPIDAMVAYYAGLTPEQRRTLLTPPAETGAATPSAAMPGS